MNKNSYVLTPPMGWNSYDYYDTTVTEEQVLSNARYMAKNLKKYGWEYIVIDIEWFAHNAGSRRKEYQYIPFNELEMDEYSRLLPDPARFPSSANGAGFKPLADKLHEMGLKLGIHIMRGIPRQAAHAHTKVLGTELTANEIADASSICRWNPDMYGVKNIPAGQAYYDSIIALYASWGIDFIKCDDICNTNMYPDNPYSARHEIEMLAKAIDKSGRGIVLSLSPGPAVVTESWHYKTYANMWRITDDLWDQWPLLKEMFWRCEQWQDHIAPGCFPDCDMLPIGVMGKGFGNGEWKSHFTYAEAKTMMSLWCIFGSPLMIGSELNLLDEETLSLITNEDVLAMLPPEVKPHQVIRTDSEAIWEAFDSDKKVGYYALFNISEERRTLTMPTQALKAKEIWSSADYEITDGLLKAELAPHDCAVYRVDL